MVKIKSRPTNNIIVLAVKTVVVSNPLVPGSSPGGGAKHNAGSPVVEKPLKKQIRPYRLVLVRTQEFHS